MKLLASQAIQGLERLNFSELSMVRACSGSIQKFRHDPEAQVLVKSFIHKCLAMVSSFLDPKNPMDPEHLHWLVTHIFNEYRDFSLEDIKIFTESLKAGKIQGRPYPKIYGAISPAYIRDCLSIYYDLKISARQEYHRQLSQQNTKFGQIGHVEELVMALTERTEFKVPEVPEGKETSEGKEGKARRLKMMNLRKTWALMTPEQKQEKIEKLSEEEARDLFAWLKKIGEIE